MSDILYRVAYQDDEMIYEIYTRELSESNMYGFIEIGPLVFGETATIVVDPSEERIKSEFAGVKRSYIPAHAIIRIDEVESQGVAKLRDAKGNSKISQFPELTKKTILE